MPHNKAEGLTEKPVISGEVSRAEGGQVVVKKADGTEVFVRMDAEDVELLVRGLQGKHVTVERAASGSFALYLKVQLPLAVAAEVEGGVLQETSVVDAAGNPIPYWLELDDRDVDDESEGPTLDLSAEWREHDGKHAQNRGD